MKKDYLFNMIRNKCLVLDIETSSFDDMGREISIFSNFEGYVERAVVKWFGAYSYKHDEVYLLNAMDENNRDTIEELLAEHDTIIGFNSEEFDYPILVNNNFVDKKKRVMHVDVMQILGKATFKNKSGYGYKDRGGLMGFKYAKNSLRCMAETMGLETQKGDIDYSVFQEIAWDEKTTEDIKKYLQGDVVATSEMFDKLWDFWLPFTDLLDPKYVKDLSWIRSSIASLTYKAACTLMGVEPTYAEKGSKKEEMGGRVIMPKYEEARNVWYIDYASLYPHIMCMFNLFSENNTSTVEHGWHGNDLFETRGYYFTEEKHELNLQIESMLKTRIDLKKNDPDNPMIYAIKIFLNGLYGVSRSAIFEKVGGENCGWDCCWLGQQIQKLTEDMMTKFGFETIYGDTDSLMVLANDEANNNEAYVKECLSKILKKINENCPFPVETFGIDIEEYLEYIMFPFSEQETLDEETRKILNALDKMTRDGDFGAIEGGGRFRTETVDKKKIVINSDTGEVVKKGRSWEKTVRGKKKNYLYIANGEVKLTGLPIKKANATHLGIKIYNEVLLPLIKEKKSAKFERAFIEEHIDNYLKEDGIMQLISQEYKVECFCDYKREKQIQAQISKAYFNKADGVINLIKNTKVGKCGQGTKYCTVPEAIEAGLTIKDLDLTKLWNELEPFIKTTQTNIEPKKSMPKPKIVQKEEIIDDTVEKKGLESYYEE